MLQHLIGPAMTMRGMGMQGMMNPGAAIGTAKSLAKPALAGAAVPMVAGGPLQGILPMLMLLGSMKR